MTRRAEVPLRDVVHTVETWEPMRSATATFTYIDLSAIDDNKEITGTRSVMREEAPSRARQVVRAGDVLVSTVRPNLNGVAIVPRALDGATASTGFCVLRPNPDLLDSSYLFHWVRSPLFVREMVRHATGASYPAIVDRVVLDSRIPLCALSEQRRIGALLNRAVELLRKQREALGMVPELAIATFDELFGDPALDQRGWPRKPLGELAAKISDGPFGSNLKSAHYSATGIRVIRLQNIGVGEFLDGDKAYISEQHFASLRNHECRPGDVLVGTLGDPNLRACVQPTWLTVALNKSDCIQLRPNERLANAAYIAGLLNHPSVMRLATRLLFGQTRLRVSMGRLRSLEVPIPPIPVQKEFARRVSALDSIRDRARQSGRELAALYLSLQDRAFHSELELSTQRELVSERESTIARPGVRERAAPA